MNKQVNKSVNFFNLIRYGEFELKMIKEIKGIPQVNIISYFS